MKEDLSHTRWSNAMLEEIHALGENYTWDLVDLPEGKKSIGSKWVITDKINHDGSVERLVAKGYAQTYGVDYLDTCSPVAKFTSVHLFVSLSTSENWPLHLFHIKNAFIHGDL